MGNYLNWSLHSETHFNSRRKRECKLRDVLECKISGALRAYKLQKISHNILFHFLNLIFPTKKHFYHLYIFSWDSFWRLLKWTIQNIMLKIHSILLQEFYKEKNYCYELKISHLLMQCTVGNSFIHEKFHSWNDEFFWPPIFSRDIVCDLKLG